MCINNGGKWYSLLKKEGEEDEEADDSNQVFEWLTPWRVTNETPVLTYFAFI